MQTNHYRLGEFSTGGEIVRDGGEQQFHQLQPWWKQHAPRWMKERKPEFNDVLEDTKEPPRLTPAEAARSTYGAWAICGSLHWWELKLQDLKTNTLLYIHLQLSPIYLSPSIYLYIWIHLAFQEMSAVILVPNVPRACNVKVKRRFMLDSNAWNIHNYHPPSW